MKIISFLAVGSAAYRQHTGNERWPEVVLLPVLATLGFYALPNDWQHETRWQFAPQLAAYFGLGIWAWSNPGIISKLGLEPFKLRGGMAPGLGTGIVLGGINTLIIIYAVPELGFDIDFLRDTPHARIPLMIMVPWLILFIALAVELNFRGFLLGRLAAVFTKIFPHAPENLPFRLAIVGSAMAFAFDPFMVTTFRHLHWVAVWDGLIWAWLRLRTGNLYLVIIAHATEVVLEFLIIRWYLL